MRRLLAFSLLAAILASECASANGNVYVSRFWHNHQPIYWPEWNGTGQNYRVQFAKDSIDLKPWQVYNSGVSHPENDLNAIFSVQDRVNAYQSGPRNSLANVQSGGYAMSYSGSLIDNVRSLAAAGSLGYGAGWWNGNREARNWSTGGGSRKLDLVGFTYHHSLGAVLPREVFRKEIQIFKEAYYKAWATGAATNHSKGYFPTEMAFSEHMIDVLSDEGYQWAIVASHHLSRTLPSYMGNATYTSPEANSWKIYSSPPNKADQNGSAEGGAWWFGTGNVGETAWNHAPYAYQLHKAKYVNPVSGAEKSIVLVPSDDIQSYKAGYSGWQKGLIDANIAPHANNSSRPCLVMPATDGDNAWGGGSSSWDGDAPSLMNNGTYPGVAIQDFVNWHAGAADTVHIEDGAWIFPETDYGSPQFLKWVEPPVSNASATNRVYNTQVDIETPGFTPKFYSWAPVIAGANWCQTAEQMTVSEGGSVQAWKIQDPYDNLSGGNYSNPNLVERAWHIFLAGLDSGFNYYGGLGNDDEVKSSLATRRAYELLATYVNDRKATLDQTPPTVFRPQRFPYNPGGYTFGWFNSIPGGNTSALKKMNSEFYVWTHAYDVSGISDIVVKIRKDADGANPVWSNVNEVYDPAALGLNAAEVGSWITVPMTKRALPQTAAELTAKANNSGISYFSDAVSPVVADYYFARIDNTSVGSFRGQLLDYYIEATDARGNVSRSDIQHVFVADDGQSSSRPDTPTNLSGTSPTGTRVNLSWAASPLATSYKIFRNGVEIGTSIANSYFDTAVSPSTFYAYTVVAVNANGQSAPTAEFSITSAAPTPDLPPFDLTGTAPSGYLISKPGMTIYAAVRGTKLYVATWYAQTANGNDHFIFVSNQLLPSATTVALGGWAKAGMTAIPASAAVLCMESSNGWAGWQWNDAKGSSLNGTVQKSATGQVEGVIDLVDTFGAVPDTLYLASAAYQTANGGILGGQAPAKDSATAGNVDGNIDPSEFLAIPVAALRDSAGDNALDYLKPERRFVAASQRGISGASKVSWSGVPGRSYLVKYKNSLSDAAWQTGLEGASITAPGATATPPTLTFTDPTPVLPSTRFYRVEVVP